ncbi:MAG: hypothetical protein NTX59_12245 [Elusimicrobia bacterium]|nr:hypothetical protein [Elusimicrobiota bacterium]
MKKTFLAVLLATGFAAGAAAQTAQEEARLAGSPVFSDPAFQDFVETSYGYMSPGNKPAAAFRDAVVSPAAVKPAPAVRAGYVFVIIVPMNSDYSVMLREISSSAGFMLQGERTSRSGGVRRTRIVGWARAEALDAIRANPGVAGLSVGKKKARTAAAL